MELKVKWSKRAVTELHSTLAYIYLNFGKASAQDFFSDVVCKRQWISENYLIGRREPLLFDREKKYYYIHVGKYNKLIYYATSHILYIVDMWDMRCCPSTLAARIKSSKKK